MTINKLFTPSLFLLISLLATTAQAQQSDPRLFDLRNLVIVEQLNQKCPLLDLASDAAVRAGADISAAELATDYGDITDFILNAREWANVTRCKDETAENYVAFSHQAGYLWLGQLLYTAVLLDKQQPIFAAVDNNMQDEIRAHSARFKNRITAVQGPAQWSAIQQSVAKDLKALTTTPNLPAVKILRSSIVNTVQSFVLEKQLIALGAPHKRPSNNSSGWNAWRHRNGANPTWAVSNSFCAPLRADANYKYPCNIFFDGRGNLGISIGAISALGAVPTQVTLTMPETIQEQRSLLVQRNGYQVVNWQAIETFSPKLVPAKSYSHILRSDDSELSFQTGIQGKQASRWVFRFPEQTKLHWKKLGANDLIEVVVTFQAPDGKTFTSSALPGNNTQQGQLIPNTGLIQAIQWVQAADI